MGLGIAVPRCRQEWDQSVTSHGLAFSAEYGEGCCKEKTLSISAKSPFRCNTGQGPGTNFCSLCRLGLSTGKAHCAGADDKQVSTHTGTSEAPSSIQCVPLVTGRVEQAWRCSYVPTSFLSL